MQELDNFERAVLTRSLRAGFIWCAFGVIGVASGSVIAVTLARGDYASHPMVLLILGAWFTVSVTAVKSGWGSVTRAKRGLAHPNAIPSTAADLDEGLDP